MAKRIKAEIEIISRDSASETNAKVKSSFNDVGASVENAGNSADRAQGRFARFSKFLKSRFVITLGDVANAVVAAFAAIKESADLQGQTQALKNQLATQGIAFDSYIKKLEEVSRGTVATADLIAASSKALLFGIPADEIVELLDIARASSIASGQSVAQAFDDIATGIGRGSVQILDNLQIVVKQEEAYEKMADAVGTTTDKLTRQQRQQALTNAVLKEGRKQVDQFGEAQTEVGTTLAQGRAELENFKNAAVQFLTGALVGLIAGLKQLVVVNSYVAEGFVKVWRGLFDLLVRIPLVGTAFQGMADAARVADDALDGFQETQEESIKNLNALSIASFKSAFGIEQQSEAAKKATPNLKDYADKVDESNNAIVDLSDAQRGFADETDRATDAVVRHIVSQKQLQTELARSTQALAYTSLEFERLEQQQGRKAAVNAALAAGGKLSLYGTRIEFASGGGSRLTSSPYSAFHPEREDGSWGHW